jgi:hypothetical protein
MASTQISGKLEDKNGNAVEGGEIMAIPEKKLTFPSNGGEDLENAPIAVASTDANGNYTISNSLLAGVNNYHVIARWTDSNGDLRQTTPNYPGLTAERPAILIDSWEDQDVAEYGGETSYVNGFVSSPAIDSYALDMGSDGSARTIISESGDGLNAYPSRGDIFECYVRYTKNDDSPYLMWALPNKTTFPNDMYRVNIEANSNTFDIAKRLNGNRPKVSSASVSTSSGTWYRIRVEYDVDSDGVIRSKLYDLNGTLLADAQINDTEYTAESFGLAANNINGNTTKQYFDFAEII